MKSFILITMLAAMLLPDFGHAQSARGSSSITEAEANKSLDMARKFILITTGLADDFIKFKGDFVQKDGSDNSYYGVKGLDINCSTQYIIVKPNGTTMYAAIFKSVDKDDKTPTMALAAFSGGILTIKNNNDMNVESGESGTLSKTIIKYYLKVKNIKVASFTFDTNENKGVLLVAIQ